MRLGQRQISVPLPSPPASPATQRPAAPVLILALLCQLGAAAPGHATHTLRTLSSGFVPAGAIADWRSHLTSPDGTWIVFEGCETVTGPCWLGSASRFGQPGDPATTLAGPLYGVFGVQAEITGDGGRVVFAAATVANGAVELWSVPIDGASAPARLHPPLVAGEALWLWEVTADGAQVVFAIHDGAGGGRLVRTAVDGSQPNVTLDQGAVEELVLFPPESGSPRVLYLIDTDNDGQLEILTIYLHLDLPFAPWPGELRAGLDLGSVRILPDGSRAVLDADIVTAGVIELWSITLAQAGAFQRLNQALVASGDVTAFALGDAGRAVYLADAVVNGTDELWSVPVDASAAPIKLSGTLVNGGDVESSFRIAGNWVVYLADATVDEKTELWSAPVAGGSAPTRRCDVVPAGRQVSSFRIAANGTRLVYRADLEEANRHDLYKTTVWGLTSHVRLTNIFALNPYDVNVPYEIAPDSSRVAFATTPDDDHDGVLMEQDLLVPQTSPEVLAIALGPDSAVLRPRYLPDSHGLTFRVALEQSGRSEVHLADQRVFADGFEGGDHSAWSATAP